MQVRPNFYLDNPDIQFHIEKKADYEILFSLLDQETKDELGVTTLQEYKDLWVATLTQIGEIAGGPLAANQRLVANSHLLLENGEVKLPDLLQKNIHLLTAAGMCGLGINSKYGGIPSPIISELPAVEILYRACPSTYLNVTWWAPIARVIEEFGNQNQKDKILPKIASGEWSGNMALTEPDAGSDLGAIRTYGEKQADGTFRLFGTKRFISNGSGMVSLVLAKKSKGDQGLSSLSLFLCLRKSPDGKNNYEVTKLEEKPGLHGSATCELKYEGSSAELIGEDGKGFQYMLHLMNEARIGVSIQGVGIMEAVLRIAKDYTQQRKTWGRPIAQHELVCEKLLDMEVTTHGIRSLCYQAANALSIAQFATVRLKQLKPLSDADKSKFQELKDKYTRRLRRWTPLVKYYAGEMAVHNARMCMQLHGGYGYTTEYQPEWWLRESLIIPVYEGTSQIQALMCLKDSMKEIIQKPTSFIESALGTKVQVLAERDPLRRKLNRLRQEYNSSLRAIVFKLVKTNMRASFSDVNPSDIKQVIQILTKELMKFENLRPALIHAERITELKVMVCIGEALVRDSKIDSSRAWIAERWLNKSLPKAAMLHAEIDSDEAVLANRLSEIPIVRMQ